jgi:hypothetical protein
MRSIALVALFVFAACKGKSDEKPPAPPAGSGSSVGSGSAAVKSGFGSGSSAAPEPAKGSGSATNELPKSCDEWKAMVDKLMACEKMPEPQRKIMKDAYDQASSLWPTMPAASKAQLATSCKAGADAIMSSAKATCGW